MIKNALSSIFFCCLDTERGNTSANGLASTWPSGPKPGFQEAHWNKRICCCAVTKHSFKLDIGRHVEYPKPCALSDMWHIKAYYHIYICTIWFILYILYYVSLVFMCFYQAITKRLRCMSSPTKLARKPQLKHWSLFVDWLSGWVKNTRSMKASDMEGAASYILLGENQ